MADHQRIHPLVANVEAPPPTRAPAPRGSLVRSDKGDPGQLQVPLGHAVAAMPPALKPPKRRNCWCKCLCWTLSLLILLLVIVGATVGILYLVFQPKLPKYSVDNLRISDLTLNFDLSLYARFNVRITAENPNKKIGIYYEKGSRLSVWYKNTNLCQGSIPKFYQGHQNRTVLNVALTGQNQYGRTLLEALQEQQQTGRIPLDLKIDVPVSIKLRKLKLKKVRVVGTCMLIVDSLSTDSLINIKASTCNFGLKL
ncbi:NDR1/HIN1-like protein 6 [Sesamum angolense]|uniref:NDR1/HIN1-like protein 6 n=1 Tax=Sesamum angolense TaxID=2727404 RepID=A0AAE1WK77_9LAMI|nr:NDR1/HIN1-like protein 6 [Sesamum angolense]